MGRIRFEDSDDFIYELEREIDGIERKIVRCQVFEIHDEKSGTVNVRVIATTRIYGDLVEMNVDFGSYNSPARSEVENMSYFRPQMANDLKGMLKEFCHARGLLFRSGQITE